MAENAHQSPLVANAAIFVDWRQRQLDWSSDELAYRCQVYAESHDPPLSTTIDRTAIWKIVNGKRGLGAADAYILAGALGVSMVAMLTNNTHGITPETPPGVIIDETAAALSGIRSGIELLGQRVGLLLEHLEVAAPVDSEQLQTD